MLAFLIFRVISGFLACHALDRWSASQAEHRKPLMTNHHVTHLSSAQRRNTEHRQPLKALSALLFATSCPRQEFRNLCRRHMLLPSDTVDSVGSSLEEASDYNDAARRLRKHEQRSAEPHMGLGVLEKLQLPGRDKLFPDSKAKVLTELQNEDEYDAKINDATEKDHVVVIGIFANWCRACKAMKPQYMKMLAEFPNVEFCSIPFENNKQLAKKLGIKSLPYVIITAGHKGTVEKFQCGRSKIPQLKEKIEIHSQEG